MNLFYMIATIFGISAVCTLIVCVIFACVYSARRDKTVWEAIKNLIKEVQHVKRIQEHDKELFDHHFGVTDQTIIEERTEKQYWKKEAIRNWKEAIRLQKKSGTV